MTIAAPSATLPVLYLKTGERGETCSLKMQDPWFAQMHLAGSKSNVNQRSEASVRLSSCVGESQAQPVWDSEILRAPSWLKGCMGKSASDSATAGFTFQKKKKKTH